MMRSRFWIAAMLLTAVTMTQTGAQVQEMLIGSTSEGGESGIGTIYRANADGTGQIVLKSFKGVPGNGPQYTRLVQLANGKLYGITASGGSSLRGVIFEYDPATGSYQALASFDGANKGAYPYGSLELATNGKLYGLTSEGGTNNKGVLFEFDLASNTLTKKHDFDGISGANPYGDLASTPSGLMYGMTNLGGANSGGVLFEFNPASGIVTKKVDLDATNGFKPFAQKLLLLPSGVLLGMATEGGSGTKGTLFEYDPVGNSITKRVDFTGMANGATPLSSLMLASNGLVYGMTLNGGTTDQGVLFQYNPTTFALTKKIDFTGGTMGILPYGGLMQATNSKIYGTTEQGVNGWGGLFEYDIIGNTITNVVHFFSGAAGPGSSPRSAPMQASNGKLYGLTTDGGAGMRGVLYEVDLGTKAAIPKVNFQTPEDASFAVTPLVRYVGGILYGMSFMGGSQNVGVIFEYNIGLGQYTKKLDLSLATGGAPTSALTLASNGLLYGVFGAGGLNSQGTLVKYDPATNTLTKLFDFNSSSGQPSGALVQSANGKLYGTTNAGGTNNLGVVYEYDINTNTFLIRASFSTATGKAPSSSLIEVGSKLYGLRQTGGATDLGALYEFDPVAGTITKKVDFVGSNGSWPYGSLSIGPNGNLYGITQLGGANGLGTIFEFVPSSGSLTTRYDFEGIGADPQEGLSLSPNGLFYGVMHQGGSDNFGILYQFNPTTYAFTKKFDFTGPNGARPYSSRPIFVSLQSQTITFGPLASKIYGDPSFALSATSSSGLPITYESSNPLVATVTGNQVSIVGAGTTTIKAKQQGNATYLSAFADQMLTVNKKAQAITFSTPSSHTYGEPPFTLPASSDSSLPLVVSSSDTNVATVIGTQVTIVGAGSTVLTANQPGSANYLPATPVQQTLVVNKATQLINFPAIPSKPANAAAFPVNVSVNSGLPLTLTSSDPTVATLSGNIVTLVAPGTTTIEASHPGNSNYLPASASQLLTVTVVVGTKPDRITAVKAYPNPASNCVFVQMPVTTLSANPYVDLINNLGQSTRLALNWVSENTYQVDLTPISPGMYVIVIPNSETRVQHLVVIR